MDESDEDFKELCASFFQRVKKNGPKEMPGERKPRKASEGSQIRSKPRRTKQTAAKSKAPPGPAERKTRSGSQAPRAKKQGTIKWQENEPAAPENGEEGPLKSACSTQTGNGRRPRPERPREEARGDLSHQKPGVRET